MIKEILLTTSVLTSLAISPVFAVESENNTTADPEALFNDAMRHRQDGELFNSIEIFETILSNQPTLNRARLELAVSYHLTRRYEDAKEQLTKVLNNPDTPASVKLSITAYLAQITADLKSSSKRSSSTMYISAGIFTDSNINIGPSAEIPGLGVNSDENKGNGGQFVFNYSHRSRASQPLQIAGKSVDFEWLTQATAYAKLHTNGDSDFNLSVLTLNTGPALIAAESWRAAFNFKLDKILFGQDDYAEFTSINPLFTYSIMKDLEITFENTTTAREYEQTVDQGLTGTATMWGIDVAKFYADQSIGVQAGVKYHDNGAQNSGLHYVGAEYYFGLQMPAWSDAQAYITLSGRDYRYLSADTINNFTIKRDETELLGIVGVSHDFRSGALKSWTLNSQYTFTNNDSNDDLFTYDRGVFEVNMRRYFF